MKIRNLFFVGFAAASLFAACEEKDDVISGTPSIKLSANTLEFEQAEDSETITLTANRDWVVEVPASASSWLTVTPTSGSASEDPQTITIEVKENPQSNRSAKLVFNASLVSDDLMVSQAGPEGGNPYQEFYEGAQDAEFTLEGTIAAINNNGVIINDGAGNVMVYNSASNYVAPTDVAIGDLVSVEGAKDIHNDFPQLKISSYSAIKVVTKGDGTFTYPAPVVVDAESFSTLDRDNCIYMQFEGTLSKSGHYYNIEIDGVGETGSLQSPLASLGADEYVGKRAVFTGYQCAGGAGFLNMLLVNVGASTSPYLSVSPSTVSIPAAGGESEINISGNVEWTAVSSNPDFTITPASGTGNGTIKVSAAANSTDQVKTATITVSTSSAEVSQKSFEVAVSQSITISGKANRADFETFNEGKATTRYGTYTTTSGWTATNCSVVTGGDVTADDTDKGIFTCIGKIGDSDQYAMAACLNGKTSAAGTLESPVLTGGCGILSFNYAHVYSESNGIAFKVEIIQNDEVVKTFTVENQAAEEDTVYSWVDNVNVSGDFTVKYTNLSPSNNASKNKDRYVIWNVEWTEFAE